MLNGDGPYYLTEIIKDMSNFPMDFRLRAAFSTPNPWI
jgi:hypothetical protein